MTCSQHLAQCTEPHRGPVEDWCRLVIGPAFLHRMFCYICSRIPTRSIYRSLLYEQKEGVTQLRPIECRSTSMILHLEDAILRVA